MALHPCPECQKDVSDKAVACPHCGMPVESRSPGFEPRRRRLTTFTGATVAAAMLVVGVALAVRQPDYSRVEQLRAEQDSEGTHDEHVRQRFFRLYKAHPKNAMYIYLWARCVDDAAEQLALATEAVALDPKFSWNYNIAARALARLGRLPEAYDYAVKGAALDPGNMQLAEKRRSLKLMLDHKLADEPALTASAYVSYDSKEHFEKGAVRYRGLFRSTLRSPDPADLQAIPAARLGDAKGPAAEAVRGFVLCSNPFADACVRAYVARDARFGAAWPPRGSDVGALREHQLVTVAGSVVTNSKGESFLLADAVSGETL